MKGRFRSNKVPLFLVLLLIITMFCGCSKQGTQNAKVTTEKLSADVVVVGAGASGVSAAVAAADKGAKVILIEKTSTIGGASNLSWAGRFVNSSLALKNNVKIDVEKNIADWIVLNHYRVNAADLRQYITSSGATYDWLVSKGYPQMQFLNFAGDPMHLLPAYNERPGIFKKLLADSVEKNGGKVLINTTGKKLLTDSKGNVTGVQAAKSGGGLLDISAKAVILATGGYAGNKKMVKEASGFDPVLGGLSQNVGEGLKMAWAVGAEKPVNFGIQMFHQTLVKPTAKLKTQYSPDKASYPLMLSYLPTLMNVSANGARFRDESFVKIPDAAANTSIYQGNKHYVIVSKTQIDALIKQGMAGLKATELPAMPPEMYLAWKDKFTLTHPWDEADKVLESMVKNGDGYKGATPAELAKNAGMDQNIFTDTFNRYEEASKTGIDNDFGKTPAYLVAYDGGPYYAIPSQINNLASVGGLNVNKSFQVLNGKKIPIKGLYAVGLESEGVLFSDAYIGNGDGIAYAFTSGRLGGEYAASNIKNTNL
jgi:fumarate reductase flavoprotein subunit